VIYLIYLVIFLLGMLFAYMHKIEQQVKQSNKGIQDTKENTNSLCLELDDKKYVKTMSEFKQKFMRKLNDLLLTNQCILNDETYQKKLANEVEATRIELLEKETKLSQELANIELQKAKELADVEVQKAKELADVEVQKELEIRLADNAEYQTVKTEELEANIRVQDYKIEANKKYIKEFLCQEYYNGDGDQDYCIRTPSPPYEL